MPAVYVNVTLVLLKTQETAHKKDWLQDIQLERQSQSNFYVNIYI